MKDEYEVLDILFNRLRREGITFDASQVGHRNYTIGGRSSYLSDANVFDFLHEVSHLIQLNDDEVQTKYSEYGLNFVYPQSELNGFIYNDPQTDKMSMRELEVFCIQFILERDLLDNNLNFDDWLDVNDIEQLFTWIPDDIEFGYKIKNSEISKKAQQFLALWDIDKILYRWFNIKLG